MATMQRCGDGGDGGRVADDGGGGSAENNDAHESVVLERMEAVMRCDRQTCDQGRAQWLVLQLASVASAHVP